MALVPIFHFKIAPNSIFWLLLLALVTYWICVFGVTVFGNIPLNEILDKINLESITLEEIKALRTNIEVKWNNLNLIRSISSGISFLLLIVSSLFLNK
ncbi:MAG: DUF1772 domain-containing protein [Flavobacteriaceae bacterium]|nr:DUF1772 domain-containing protein [Flavobacteriaceae bacterium]